MTYIAKQARETLKRLVFGSAAVPQQCGIGLRDPQSEVSVWLHGFGPPRDVTYRNVVAAARPFTIGVGLEQDDRAVAINGTPASLEFRERGGEQHRLGEIYLGPVDLVPVGEHKLCLLRAQRCRNYCLPRPRLWARYLQYDYEQRRRERRSGGSIIRMPARELHSLFVFYICPRPVVLVSVADGDLVNIFPMDLIGSIAPGYFSLALHSTSAAAPLMERSRKVALGSVPVEQASIAYELGKNHKRPCIDWAQIAFTTNPSPLFGIPVPSFSLRVRELQIEAVRTIGTHKLFLARTVEDQSWSDGTQLFFVHGFYQAWRQQPKHQAAAVFTSEAN
jgi:flavin reductase (DIM6/NTAB) family NADH-FMN oxidoreductase RutF